MLILSRSLAGLAVLVGLAVAQAASAAPEHRVALVIGNSAYRTVPSLSNPRNDAEDVAAALEADGFTVIAGHDLDRRGMGEALGRFAREADSADVALFYYAGHGLQFRGENFLVPVDGAPADEFAIPYETTRLADVLDALSHARGVRLLVLDACRNNPLAERIARSSRSRDVGVSRGLARIAQGQGMVIAYATQANDVAADGQGRNSPFSAAFVEELKVPGLEVGQLFRRVAVSVNQRTGGQQTPELSISLLGDFYFNRAETDTQAWTRLRGSTDPASLQGFLARFPGSLLADAARARLEAIARDPPRATETAAREPPSAKGGGAVEAAPTTPAEQVASPPVTLPVTLPSTTPESTPESTPGSTPGSTPPDAAPGLVAAINRELERLGCYRGRLDGAWSSPTTTRSVREFARLARLEPPGEPSPAFLDALRAQRARVCPLVCGPRQVARGDVCSAKTCPRGERLDAQGDCVVPPAPKSVPPPRRVVQRAEPVAPIARPKPRPAAPTRSAPAAGGRCFNFNGRSFCE